MRGLGVGLEDIKIGHWTDRKSATGCTVILCETEALLIPASIPSLTERIRE